MDFYAEDAGSRPEGGLSGGLWNASCGHEDIPVVRLWPARSRGLGSVDPSMQKRIEDIPLLPDSLRLSIDHVRDPEVT